MHGNVNTKLFICNYCNLLYGFYTRYRVKIRAVSFGAETVAFPKLKIRKHLFSSARQVRVS
jgi:hypothetical protein